MLPDYFLTWTRTPRAYATGGTVAVTHAQMARDPGACHMPAGVVRVSHGVWFAALTPREA